MPARTIIATLTDTPTGLLKIFSTKSITFPAGESIQFVEGFTFAELGDTVVIEIPTVASDFTETGLPALEPDVNLTFIISEETFAITACQNQCDSFEPSSFLIRELSDSGICVTTDIILNASQCVSESAGEFEENITDDLRPIGDQITGTLAGIRASFDEGTLFFFAGVIAFLFAGLSYISVFKKERNLALITFYSSLVIQAHPNIGFVPPFWALILILGGVFGVLKFLGDSRGGIGPPSDSDGGESS